MWSALFRRRGECRRLNLKSRQKRIQRHGKQKHGCDAKQNTIVFKALFVNESGLCRSVARGTVTLRRRRSHANICYVLSFSTRSAGSYTGCALLLEGLRIVLSKQARWSFLFLAFPVGEGKAKHCTLSCIQTILSRRPGFSRGGRHHIVKVLPDLLMPYSTISMA